MSLLDCISNAEKEGPANGGLTKEQAKKARQLFIDFKVHNEANMKMSPADADAKAGQDTFDVLEYEAFQKKRRMILQRATLTRALKNLESYKGPNKGEAMIAFLERDGKGLSPYSNVTGRQAVVRGMAHSLMSDVINGLRKTQVTGRTTRKAKAKSEAMVREVFGENTGD